MTASFHILSNSFINLPTIETITTLTVNGFIRALQESLEHSECHGAEIACRKFVYSGMDCTFPLVFGLDLNSDVLNADAVIDAISAFQWR
jgi:hypothetical protein